MFRANVGAVIAGHDGRVLLFERADIPGAWQFPQGGVGDDEDPEAAVLREVFEETGIEPASLTRLATHPSWLGYELPSAKRSPKTGRGQVQKWFLFRLEDDVDIELPEGEGAEFVRYRWAAIDEAAEVAVGFKRPVYESVVATFRPIVAAGVAGLTPEGREYLLAELDHVSAALISNEETGERRVVSFVTFIALLATAVGLVSESLPQAGPVETLWLAFAALLASLAVGLLTLRRLLKRNVGTTRMQRELLGIRSALAAADPKAKHLTPFGVVRPRRFRWSNGGLAETVAVLNSLLVAAGVALVATHLELPGVGNAIVSAVAFGTAAGVQRYFAVAYYADRLRENDEPQQSQKR